MQSLTQQDIENRNYTYVTTYSRDASGELYQLAFLVSSPYREEAIALARKYVTQRGHVIEQSTGACACCNYFYLYPRNYVRKARKLYVEGKYL